MPPKSVKQLLCSHLCPQERFHPVWVSVHLGRRPCALVPCATVYGKGRVWSLGFPGRRVPVSGCSFRGWFSAGSVSVLRCRRLLPTDLFPSLQLHVAPSQYLVVQDVPLVYEILCFLFDASGGSTRVRSEAGLTFSVTREPVSTTPTFPGDGGHPSGVNLSSLHLSGIPALFLPLF